MYKTYAITEYLDILYTAPSKPRCDKKKQHQTSKPTDSHKPALHLGVPGQIIWKSLSKKESKRKISKFVKSQRKNKSLKYLSY